MSGRRDEDARGRVLTHAAEEAGRRGDGRIGSEHLLLALLHGPDPLAAQVLAVDHARLRAARDGLDRDALAAVGVDIDELPPHVAHGRARLPLTAGARAVLHRAVTAARAAGARRVTSWHLVLGVLERQPPDPAATLLAAAGVDPAAARRRLVERAT